MIKRAVDYAKKVLFIPPKVPKQVDIEICTACNLSCRMCKREKFDFGDEMMPFDTFTKIVDRLPGGVESISFGGYGEMLMHPRFFDMVKYAKQKGFHTETTSNGTLLPTDKKIMELLDSGLDSLRVSVDHIRPPEDEKDVGHAFNGRILKDLKRLSELRDETGSTIQLGINTVVQKGNVGEVVDIVRKAEELNFDLVELIRLDTCMNNAERTLQVEKERELYKKIENMPKRIEVVTPANRFGKWRRLYNAKDEFCIFRYQSAHIRMNGAVTPCAFGFAVYDFGNVHEQGLEEIWQSEKFSRIRKNGKNPVCQSCGIFKWGKEAAPEPEQLIQIE